MKIISQMPNERVLISIKDDELANILGSYSKYDIKKDFIDQAIKTEVEIEICDIYQKHRLINSIQNSAEYETARRKLEEMLRALTPIENKIELLSKK